ncbi:hypothetical protein [Ruminococcus sp. FC2018]|uniref:putative ABC transporter permease n=1 Tax=Ruminococcus sp. FC2018 TaxID=1410617 RepID=UPI000683F084
MKVFCKLLTVFVFGGFSYGAIEVFSRGYTYISMGLAGGVCLVIIHLLNDERRNGMKLNTALIISLFFILSGEFLTGEILNRTLDMHIWNYSSSAFNIDGQICLLYSLAWYTLSFVGIVFDEWMRLKIFGEKSYPIFASVLKKNSKKAS